MPIGKVIGDRESDYSHLSKARFQALEKLSSKGLKTKGVKL